VSEAIRRECERYGLDAAKAEVIRPAVDPQVFYPEANSKAQDGAFHVVSVGNLSWVKGFEYALEAVRLLADRGVDVRFDIIGHGPERHRLLYTIADLGLGERVRLLGRREPEEVRAHLRKADAFLLSSVTEGISNAVLEAMSTGVPVVTTDCGGMGEAVTDGVEGFVVPTRDPAAIASALTRLAADATLRIRMGDAARLRIVGEFSLSRQVERFVSLCQKNVGLRGGQA
jgi:glycosyltransferase involved in cell wall biosynthesis